MPSFFASATSRANSCERAELRVDRVVPALLRADRPRAAGIARLRALERVVPALAVRDGRSGGSAAGRRRRSRARRAAAAARARPRSRPTSAGRARTTRRSARARGRRRPRTSPTTPSPSGRRRARRAPPRPSALARRAARAPSDELAREVRLARVDLAPQLVLERRDAVDPRLDAEAPASRRGRRRTSPPSGRCRAARAAPPASASRRPACSGPRRRASRGRRGRSAPTRRRGRRRCASPDSGRSRSAASTRWIWIRGGASVFGSSHAGSLHRSRKDQTRARSQRSAGILLHPTSLPAGQLGDEAYRFVDWLAAAGQSWWQVLPLGPPDEFGSPYRVAVGVRRLAAAPRRAATRAVTAARDRGLRRAPPVLDRRRGRASPAPDAIADQVRFEREWSALRAYARRARRAADRRRADLRLRRRRRRRGWPELFAARRGRRRAARRAQRDRPALGQPALRLAGAPRDAATAGGVERFRRDVRARRPLRASTTSAASSRTGRSRRGTRRRKRGRWRRGPGRRALPTRSSASSATCR